MAAQITVVKDFTGYNFSGRDLSCLDMSDSIYRNCNFDNANLSQTNCSRSDFSGSSLRQTNCYRTNFTDASLASTIFEPSDAYGVTFTLNCRTFDNMRISQLWWYSWIMFATQMVPAVTPVKEPIKDALIAMIGAERYVKLKALFQRREI